MTLCRFSMRTFAGTLFLFLLSACSLFTTSDGSDAPTGAGEAVPGTIVSHGDTSTVTLSTEFVASGRPVTVTVQTFGGGCVPEPIRTDVEVDGQTATIRPIDRSFEASSEVCTLEIRYLEHTTSVTFDEPGRATLRVVGWEKGSGREPPTLTTIERSVVVH